jgi:hypothetical protein
MRGTISDAVRQELNAMRRAEFAGPALLDNLSRLYHRHNLREAGTRRANGAGNDDLPVIVCSEARV